MRKPCAPDFRTPPGKLEAYRLHQMAKEYGSLPSTLRALPAGEILYDLEVFGIGCEIDARVQEFAYQKNGTVKAKAYLKDLTNRARAWREKRKRG